MRAHLLTLASILALTFATAHGQKKQRSSLQQINNDSFWSTQNGLPIYSQGGGIFKFKDPESGLYKYYWYGVHYKEAEFYRQDPSITHDHATFEGVTCYTSSDLINWKYEHTVLSKEETNKNDANPWVGRLGVAFIASLNQYAMFVQHQDQVLVALANAPTGDFKASHLINMKNMIGTPNTGDQTVFTDEDTGKSYLVYSYGRGRNKIYISEIGLKDGKVGLLDCTEIFTGEGREGNCMFKYKGKYYMCASNLYGWDSSFAYYLMSDDIRGPYLPANDMNIIEGSESDYAHVSQTGFFVTLKGTMKETVIYCGDRWANFAGNGLGYNQWCPISFEGDRPIFNSVSAWHLNARSGQWKVAADNNFVKNGSFEADRKYIPSKVKPVQEDLLGWKTEVIQGTPISQQDSISPVLNYFNTAADRQEVTGEKSLKIHDRVSYKRKVSQKIKSTKYLPLSSGKYRLTAKVKNSSGFNNLVLYAKNQKKTYRYTVVGETAAWKKIKIENISIRHGEVEIGVLADGNADAVCYVDDIELVKTAK